MHEALVCVCLLAALGESHAPSASEAAERIDRHLERHFQRGEIVAAPRADDAEFHRRVTLDLIGRIPTPDEVRQFLADPRSDKRALLLDRLLADEEHAEHFADVWRALLLPEADSDREVQYFETGFKAWLAHWRRQGRGFDDLVRELLTAPIVGPAETPQVVLRDLNRPNPIAFIAAKGAAPEKLAAATTRLFLGIRLECAECHDHPFDTWTSTQFWNQAAFFAGIQRHGQGTFAPLTEDSSVRTIAPTGLATQVPARFLDDAFPAHDAGVSGREALAEWIVAPDNPYFAQAIVNRLWGQLMGVGIVDPVDDFHAANPASHPDLLQELANALVAADFDVDFLYRAICLSQSYQRTSRQTDPTQDDARDFARMAIKPLSVEQLYASLLVATGKFGAEAQSTRGQGRGLELQRLADVFLTEPDTGPPTTSILQSLLLMNGDFIDKAASPGSSPRLSEVIRKHSGDVEGQIEALYLSTVSRLPTPEQSQRLVAHVDSGTASDPADHARRLGDVLWALLNSAEFRWNH
jgi:hypothetical protein